MNILDELFPDSTRAAPSQVSTDSFDPLKFVQQNQALGTRAISSKYELQQQQLELNRLRQEQLQLGIDAKTKLAVFEYGKDDYQLYIPAENAMAYNIVVNYCLTQKQTEFKFDKIDYKKLLSR